MPCKEYEIEHPKARNNAKCSFALRHVMVMMVHGVFVVHFGMCRERCRWLSPLSGPFSSAHKFFRLSSSAVQVLESQRFPFW